MQVVKGLDEGILSMKVGGKRRLYVPGSVSLFIYMLQLTTRIGFFFLEKSEKQITLFNHNKVLFLFYLMGIRFNLISF